MKKPWVAPPVFCFFVILINSLRNAGQIDQWHCEKGMLAFALREPCIGGSVVDVLVRPDVPFDRLMANATVGELFGRQVCRFH